MPRSTLDLVDDFDRSLAARDTTHRSQARHALVGALVLVMILFSLALTWLFSPARSATPVNPARVIFVAP